MTESLQEIERRVCAFGAAHLESPLRPVKREYENLMSAITRVVQERGKLEKALREIRDSTFRSAVTLRGMADRALSTAEG